MFDSMTWSLLCSGDSSGSWYIMLLDLLLRPFLPSFMLLSFAAGEDLRRGGDLVPAAKERVRGMRREDSLAVLK